MEEGIIPISISKPHLVGAIELVQIGKTSSEDQESDILSKFYGILRGLTVSNVPFCLRFERIRSNTRIYFVAQSRKEQNLVRNLSILEQTLKANLPECRFSSIVNFTPQNIGTPTHVACGHLLGEPMNIEHNLQRKDILTSVSEVIQSLDNVVFQVFVEPRESKESEIRRIESEYNRALENSETTITAPQGGLLAGKEQESRRKVNVRSARKAEQLKKKLNRYSNKYLCDVRVTSISWGMDKAITRDHASRPLNILRGVVIPADEKQDFSLKVKGSKKEFRQLLAGIPTGKKTTLSIPEALTYLILPDTDMGIQVAERAEFHSNPQILKLQDVHSKDSDSADSIDFGFILDERDNPVERLKVHNDSFATSMGVFGDTGGGKTTTVVTALHELTGRDIPFLALLAGKDEDYLPFFRIHPDTRIFTVGDETTAPLRFNPHQFCSGVLVNSVISNVKTAYIAALPSIGMTKEYQEATIDLTFERLGWNRDTNKRGHPLLLSDFLDSLPHIDASELDYSDKMNQDFRGALKGRFNSLQRGPLSRVFNTLTGITTEELVAKPTIILMDGLTDEEKALLSALLIVNVAQYFESLKKTASARKGLKHIIVIEEAHNLLSGNVKNENSDEGHAAVQHAIKTILRSMREGRSSGLGFMIIDQLPRELPDAAVAIPRTVILHNLSSIQDRNKVCDQINCSEAQKRKVGALPVGQAVVKLPDRAEPVRVNITPISKKYPELDGLYITNDELKAHMKKVYDKWPAYREGVSPSVIASGLDPRMCARILRFEDVPLFRKAITIAITNARKGNVRILALSVMEFAKLGAREPSNIPLYCQYFIWLLEKFGISDEVQDILGFEIELKSQISSLEKVEWIPLEATAEQLEELTSIGQRYFETAMDKDPLNLKKEARMALRAAIDERNRQKRIPHAMDRMIDVPLDPAIEEFVQGVVDTEDFAKLYFERLRKAANGDLIPIVNMIVKFIQRTGVKSSLLQTLARRYLEVSRKTLGAPEDEELWSLIVTQVKGALTA